MFPAEFYDYLTRNTLIEVKGGLKRHSFIKIWMVEVDNRIFARSWNKSEKSWFTEFKKTGIGNIRYGDKIIKVNGVKIASENPINKNISEAYLKKYNQPENFKYSNGISKAEYFDYTMEFIYYN